MIIKSYTPSIIYFSIEYSLLNFLALSIIAVTYCIYDVSISISGSSCTICEMLFLLLFPDSTEFGISSVFGADLFMLSFSFSSYFLPTSLYDQASLLKNLFYYFHPFLFCHIFDRTTDKHLLFSLLFTPFTVTRFAMQRLQVKLRGIWPVNSNPFSPLNASQCQPRGKIILQKRIHYQKRQHRNKDLR